VLVGGESKLGSIEDDPADDGDMPKVLVAQPLDPIDLVNFNDEERPTPCRYAFDAHTEGSNGIYGLTREACWVCEGVSHPEPNVDVFILLFSVSVYLLMYVYLSLNHALSNFLHWNLPWLLFRIVSPGPMRLNIVQSQRWRVAGLCGGMQ
jgi:hypothetical protein